MQAAGPQEERDCCWNESALKRVKDTASLEATSSTASQPDALLTEMLLPLHYDGCKAGSDTSNWLFSMAGLEAGKDEFLIDSGAAPSVLPAVLPDSFGGKPSGAAVESSSASHRATLHHFRQYADPRTHP